jgi:GxxExxY protein
MCNKEKGERGKTGRRELDDLVYKVIGCLIEVHKRLGPGFMEKVYRRALEIELSHRGIGFESEKEISLEYRGHHVGKHRLDLLIEDELVVELKTVEALHKKHYAQVRSYLKATGTSVGLLVNFADFQLDPRRVELK